MGIYDQTYSSRFSPTNQDGQYRYGINANRAGVMGAMPQNFSVGQFNAAAQNDPGMAFKMANSSGQDFRNAVMSANGWTDDQFNRFLNNQAFENTERAYSGWGPGEVGKMQGYGSSNTAPDIGGVQPNDWQNWNGGGPGVGGGANPSGPSPNTPAGAAGTYGSGYTGYGASNLAYKGPPGANTKIGGGDPALTQSGGPVYGGGAQTNTKPTVMQNNASLFTPQGAFNSTVKAPTLVGPATVARRTSYYNR